MVSFELVKLYFNSFLLFILILFLGVGCKANSKSNEFTPGSPQYKGLDIFVRMACNACHSIDGSLKLGPTMKNQFGKEILHNLIWDEQRNYITIFHYVINRLTI